MIIKLEIDVSSEQKDALETYLEMDYLPEKAIKAHLEAVLADHLRLIEEDER